MRKILVILFTILIVACANPINAATYTVHMYNVDDIAKLYINGDELYKAKWGQYGVEPDWYYHGHKPGNSGVLDITSDLLVGDNLLRFTLEDTACCGTSLSIEVKKDDQMIFSDFYDEYHGSGIWYDKTITLNVVPIPGAFWLFGSGLFGLLGIGRKFKE